MSTTNNCIFISDITFLDFNTWHRRWPNFSPAELCSEDMSLYMNFEALDKLQAVRREMGIPLTINSAYRNPAHNIKVGGVKNSKHLLGQAFDISIEGLDKHKLYKTCKAQGFKGFGFYETFLHVDIGEERGWGKW